MVISPLSNKDLTRGWAKPGQILEKWIVTREDVT